MSFINQFINALKKNSDAENASYMTDYMRGKFQYFGVKTKPRRDILKTVIDENKNEIKENIREITLEFYLLPQRELHVSATEIFEKELRRTYFKEDIKIIEQIITQNSWWDTVDFIAKQILGKYLLKYPEEIQAVISGFSKSKNMWLNRSAILFQLGYKSNTDERLLFEQCENHKHSEEFFIQKAIGWALREYGKSNPESVLNFVNSTTLKPLSHREAIRNII
jgi:3-methyladenine DNA glycosylase AlkD